jgi:NADPH-dependent 2,4-dienoyl-CoA reductase/sulfur reductase-like enzyme
MAYPAVGYGPPPINRIVLYPDLFAALPAELRRRLTARLLRPGGSPWVRSLVEGNVRLTEGTTVRKLERDGDTLRLALGDGSEREADAVILATGYRFALERLPFLSPELRARIGVDGGWPVLDRDFRSTDRGVYFVGYPAEGRFGPLSRFVLGTRFTATRVGRALAP